ncbi:DHS-like NAD/FAD-binding domain-containing protein [Dipodascopsis uninucleata]
MIRVPYNLKSIPPLILPPSASTLEGAASAVSEFLSPSTGKTTLLTGAGISVDSGIPDYRGPSGTYTVNKDYRPIFYSEFINNHIIRRRYWARSFLGWPAISLARPNKAHEYVGKLMNTGKISNIITQNVDSLHSAYVKDVTEIHGSLAKVICLTCGSTYGREEVQTQLSKLNPAWNDLLLQELDRLTKNASPDPIKDFRLNPDGDLELPSSVRYEAFEYPTCPSCASKGIAKASSSGAWITENEDVDVPHSKRKCKDVGVLKPNVVFFGEHVDEEIKKDADRKMQEASKILVAASSLATYSAFRLIKEGKTTGKRIGIINMGPVRGEHDILTTDDIRVSFKVADILGLVLENESLN